MTLKTAWFMGHRIREAMREGDLAPFGSNGGTVEVDETFIGKDEGIPKRRDMPTSARFFPWWTGNPAKPGAW